MLITTNLFMSRLHLTQPRTQGDSVNGVLARTRAAAAQERFSWISQTAHRLEATYSRDALQVFFDVLRGPVAGIAPMDTYELAFGIATEYWRLSPHHGVDEAAGLKAEDVRDWLNAACKTCQANCPVAGIGRLPHADDEKVRCPIAARHSVDIVM